MKNKNIKRTLKTFCLGLCLTVVVAPYMQAAKESKSSKLATFALTTGTSTAGAGFGLVSLLSLAFCCALITDETDLRGRSPSHLAALVPAGFIGLCSGALSLLSFGTAAGVFYWRECRDQQPTEKLDIV